MTTGWRVARIGLLLGCAGCHTDPFPPDNRAAIGPQNPGVEAQLDSHIGLAADLHWSADGNAILFTATPRPASPGDSLTALGRNVDSLDQCPIIMPATGGSALLEACDHDFGHQDSIDIVVSAALDPSGMLLFAKTTAPAHTRTFGAPSLFPATYHTELYLADTNHLGGPHAIAVLYRDSVGQAVVPSTAVNWLQDITWDGWNRFVALGSNLAPDGTFTPIGVVVGSISNGAATLSVVPGSATLTNFAIAGDGGPLVFQSGSLQLNRMSIGGGAATALAAIPAAANRQIIDFSCRQSTCIVLTQQSTGAISQLWSLPLNGDAPVLVYGSARPLASAKVSPRGRDVVALSGNVPFLLTGVVP